MSFLRLNKKKAYGAVKSMSLEELSVEAGKKFAQLGSEFYQREVHDNNVKQIMNDIAALNLRGAKLQEEQKGESNG